ncbi:alanine racemase [Celeribacter halophilus]|uniref:alanine racemase n=1 Tax=Celeribacter halophilus TaxID=576117 RepID=A0A1I3Q9N2_9RHOB|nr:alanine racemase [Celeribacter halophilus]PZX14098.1 alanine racemase [Celeribacter halophilus]SFJ29816.1 alanine racemase [Celeribacter halophilus]
MTTPDPCPSSWCTIHLDRIAANLALALGLVPEGRRFCAVLKADAYGHGIAQVVPIVREQGVTCIGITSNAEARAVRKAGFDGDLIRLRAATPHEIEGALSDRVQEYVSSPAIARELHQHIKSGRLKTKPHLALNAGGMSRDGLEIATTAGRENCLAILDLLGERIGGISSHFPSNLPQDLCHSNNLFQKQVDWVFDNSHLQRDAVCVHAGSSLTLISDTDIDTDMYRCGAILYGILKPELGFRPTLDLEARVVSLQDYPEGSSIGYDRAAHLSGGRRLACISIGYENGFRRLVQEDCVVAIRNQPVPVLGKVSMNAIVADVTEVAGVSLGDTVSIFGGASGNPVTQQRVEQQFGTILADLYTDWGLRNPRFYRR